MNREQLRKFRNKLKNKPSQFAGLLQSQIVQSDIHDVFKIWKLLLEDKKLLSMMNSHYLPTSISDFGKEKFMFEPKANNLSITQWVIYLVQFYSENINTFIELKIKYENALFSEHYQLAKEILEIIENEVCVSMWSLCQKFIIEEKINGLEGNKKLLSESMKKTEKNPLLAILFEYSSVRAEENMSYLNYQDQTVKYLCSLENDMVIHKYCDFKINNEYIYDGLIYGISLQLDSQMSIIDLYETFIRLIQFQSISNLEVVDMLSTFSNCITDYRVRNLLVRFQNEDSDFESYISKENIKFYENLDLYSQGLYLELIEKFEVEDFEENIDFQSLLLYIKSSLNSGIEMNFNCSIVQDVFNVYSINESSFPSINHLYNMMKMYKETRWYFKLRGFLNRKLDVTCNNDLHYLTLINDMYLSPNFVEIIENNECKKNFLDAFNSVCPITSNLFKYKYNAEPETDKLDKIDVIRKMIFDADNSISKGRNSTAIELLIKIKGKGISINNNVNEKVLVRLFNAYCNNQRYEEAVELTVNSYLLNQDLIRKLNLNSIIEKVKRTNDIKLKRSIYAPIFTHIAQPLNFKNQRVVVSNFMGHNKYSNFDEVFNCGLYDSKLLCYFIHKICTLHFLNREPGFSKSPEEAENIRIKLLWRLLDLDPSNLKQYYDEISKIMLEKSIRSNISKINQSKVTVEVDKIKSEYYDILNENFEKYLSMKEFVDDYNSVDITSSEYLEDIRAVATKVTEKIRTDKNYTQRVIVLRKILVRITEEFLFNTKYGLDTYLSSRIRHGYCRYQLTDSFIDYNLLSKTRSDNSKEFVENEYWDQKLEGQGIECSDAFKKCISSFTTNIENKVDEVKNHWIKIRYTSSEDGLLDFTQFIETFLSSILLYDIKFDDFEIFFSRVIEELWGWLEISLEKLRSRIVTELYSFFISELDILQENILLINDKYMSEIASEVLQNINLCKKNIENATNEFAAVLYKNDIIYKDFYMKTLVATSTEISGKLNSNFKNVTMDIDINIMEQIDGKLFPYFVDIFNMLITNANIHSGYSDLRELKIKISVDIVESLDELKSEDYEFINYDGFAKRHMRLSVVNSLSPTLNLSDVQEAIREKIDNLADKDIVRKHSRVEGGTGIYKIYNILKYNVSGKSLIAARAKKGQFIFTIYIPYETVVKGENHEDTIYRG